MPPRKSDQPRNSDVSNARFEVMEEDTPAPSAPVVAGLEAGAVAPGPDASPPAVLPRIGHEEKKDDKERETEKKDKGDKDAVAIEVRKYPNPAWTSVFGAS